MENPAELYTEEPNPANEIKGFTKSFQKRSKAKREEDPEIKEILSFQREGKITVGTRVTEKSFKNSTAKKVFVAANCEELSKEKIKHYGQVAGIDVVELRQRNDELGQKLGKPFLVSMVCVKE